MRAVLLAVPGQLIALVVVSLIRGEVSFAPGVLLAAFLLGFALNEAGLRRCWTTDR